MREKKRKKRTRKDFLPIPSLIFLGAGFGIVNFFFHGVIAKYPSPSQWQARFSRWIGTVGRVKVD